MSARTRTVSGVTKKKPPVTMKPFLNHTEVEVDVQELDLDATGEETEEEEEEEVVEAETEEADDRHVMPLGMVEEEVEDCQLSKREL